MAKKTPLDMIAAIQRHAAGPNLNSGQTQSASCQEQAAFWDWLCSKIVSCAQDHHLPDESSLPFADIWSPYAAVAATYLTDADANPVFVRDLQRALLHRLCVLGQEPLWHMFETWRGAGPSMIAALGPAVATEVVPRDQYLFFVNMQCRNNLADLMQAYPVLQRLIPTVLAFGVVQARDLQARLQKDRDALNKVFGIPPQAVLCEVNFGAGDAHHQGASVCILRFAWADQQRALVYKPRDMALEAAFYDLLGKIDAEPAGSSLPRLKTYLGAGYGYMEFAESRPCTTAAELTQFYYMAGRLCAILYVLGFTDGHLQNFVAQGPNLYLVDGETLLTPLCAPAFQPRRASDRLGSAAAVWAQFDQGLARLEMLPFWTAMAGADAAIDTSALGADPREWPRHVMSWRHINTDYMARALVPHVPPLAPALPFETGNNPFAAHGAVFAEGLRAQANGIIANRSKWLEAEGFLQGFSKCRGRVVLRATRIYGALLQHYQSAQALGGEGKADQILNALDKLFDQPHMDRRSVQISASERQQMRHLDIPVFTHDVTKTDLLLPHGRRLGCYFVQSALDDCRARIAALSPASIERLIKTGAGMVAAKQLHIAQVERFIPTALDSIEFLDSLPRAAHPQEIANRLIIQARSQAGGWVGFDLAQDGLRFDFRPLGMSLVSGSLGVAVFLAAVGTEEARLLAQTLVTPLVDLAETASGDVLQKWWRDQPLGLRGCGGQILALQALAKLGLLPDRILHAQHRLIAALNPKQVVAAPWDIWSGTAGLVGPIALARGTQTEGLLAALADNLANWARDGGAAKATSGFAMGVAGPIAALHLCHQTMGRAGDRAAMDQVLTARLHAPYEAASEPAAGWAYGQEGGLIAWISLLGDEIWQPAALRAIKAVVDAPLRAQGRDLFCGAAGCMALHCIAASAIEHQTSPKRAVPDGASDLRHLGVFFGLAGLGLARLSTTNGLGLLQTLLSAGLLPPKGAGAV